jgi:hypothetical protein
VNGDRERRGVGERERGRKGGEIEGKEEWMR